MIMKKLNLKSLAVLTFMSLGMASCGYVEDYVEPTPEPEPEPSISMEEQAKLDYAAAFKTAFGEISADQNWDLSLGLFNVQDETRSSSTYSGVTVEKSEGNNGWYEVQDETLSWMKSKLPEGKSDNKKLGSPFVLQSSGYPFQIIPIYQGQAGLSWDLHLVIVGGKADGTDLDINLWSKGEGMQMKGKNSNNWSNVGTGNTLSASYVRSRTITINDVPSGKTMYLYLEQTSETSTYGKKGSKQSSLDQMIVNLKDCPAPTNIGSTEIGTAEFENEVSIIGCEDNSTKNSDWDMNDIVFLMVGKPFIPHEVPYLDNEYDEISHSKRYMAEDLGTTDDFDFNDIVVDFEHYQSVKTTKINGVITKVERSEPKQRAIIRHLGGTLSWNLFIKGTSSDIDVTGKRYGVMDYDSNEIIELTGTPWNWNTNNVYLKVDKLSSDGAKSESATIEYPTTGAVPLMIATDTNKAWMAERQKINWGPFQK